MDRWLDRKTRIWLYSIAVAVVPILVTYDVVSDKMAPVWLNLIGVLLAVAAPAVALGNITPKVEEPAADERDPLDAGDFAGDPSVGVVELEDQA